MGYLSWFSWRALRARLFVSLPPSLARSVLSVPDTEQSLDPSRTRRQRSLSASSKSKPDILSARRDPSSSEHPRSAPPDMTYMPGKGISSMPASLSLKGRLRLVPYKASRLSWIFVQRCFTVEDSEQT